MNDVPFSQLVSWENLYLAWLKAGRGRRQKAEVALFEHQLEENLLSLQADLLARRWEPGGYHSFFIHDPKRRLISAAPFPDRVVHMRCVMLLSRFLREVLFRTVMRTETARETIVRWMPHKNMRFVFHMCCFLMSESFFLG